MEKLKIYIDRLKGGQIQKIEEQLTPDFLEVDEENLSFEDPVTVRGEVYIANEHLIAHLSVETFAYLPCSICNENVHIPLIIKNIYSTHPLSEISNATFDLTEEIRESILLQTPLFAECNNGKCPERDNIKIFFKPREKVSENNNDITYFPFADLDIPVTVQSSN